MVSIADAIAAGELLIYVSALGCEFCQSDNVNPRADLLCRRIEQCRRVLREGVDAASSIHYLYEIFAAEEELAELLRLDPQPTQRSTAQP